MVARWWVVGHLLFKQLSAMGPGERETNQEFNILPKTCQKKATATYLSFCSQYSTDNSTIIIIIIIIIIILSAIGSLACFPTGLTANMNLTDRREDSLDGGSALSQDFTYAGQYKHKQTRTSIHASTGIRTHDPDV
jgi:hypothetical protein